jgi:hypothetical protein
MMLPFHVEKMPGAGHSEALCNGRSNQIAGMT